MQPGHIQGPLYTAKAQCTEDVHHLENVFAKVDIPTLYPNIFYRIGSQLQCHACPTVQVSMQGRNIMSNVKHHAESPGHRSKSNILKHKPLTEFFHKTKPTTIQTESRDMENWYGLYIEWYTFTENKTNVDVNIKELLFDNEQGIDKVQWQTFMVPWTISYVQSTTSTGYECNSRQI